MGLSRFADRPAGDRQRDIGKRHAGKVNAPHSLVVVSFDRAVGNAGVDLGGDEILMAEQLLNTGDIHACIEQAGGQRVAQAMGGQRRNADRGAEGGQTDFSQL